MTPALADVIAALEGATAGSGKLNRMIACCVGLCLHDRTKRSGAQSDTGFTCLDCGADSWGNLGTTGQKLHGGVPLYTTSLDAALTLVPTEGFGVPWSWRIGNSLSMGFFAKIGTALREHWAPTAPLAVCLACLRARAAQGPGERDGFPWPIKPDARKGKPPCGECHLQPGEICDICGARAAQVQP